MQARGEIEAEQATDAEAGQRGKAEGEQWSSPEKVDAASAVDGWLV